MNKFVIIAAAFLSVVPVSAADFPVFDGPTLILPEPGNGFAPPVSVAPSPRPEPTQQIVENHYHTWNITQNNTYVDVDVNVYDNHPYGRYGRPVPPPPPRGKHFDFDPYTHHHAPVGFDIYAIEGFWHERPQGETIDWYMSNIVGNPYPYIVVGQVHEDLNRDGWADITYTVTIPEIAQTFTSIWIYTRSGYNVHNEVWKFR